MTEVSITVEYSDISADVYAETGFMGKKKGDMDTIAATGDDKAVLDGYFMDAAQELAAAVSRVGSLTAVSATSATFGLSLPGNWREAVRPALERAMRKFMAAFMVYQWFNLAKDDKMRYYAETAEGLQKNINKYLYERSHPKRSS